MRNSGEAAVLSGAVTVLAILTAVIHWSEPATWTFALSMLLLHGITVLSYYIVFESEESDEWQGWIYLFKEGGPIALIFVPGRITWKTYEWSNRYGDTGA